MCSHTHSRPSLFAAGQPYACGFFTQRSVEYSTDIGDPHPKTCIRGRGRGTRIRELSAGAPVAGCSEYASCVRMSSQPLGCCWLAAIVIMGGQGARAPGACLLSLALSGCGAQLQLLCPGVLWLQAAWVTVLSTVPCVLRPNMPCPCVPCPSWFERLNTELGSAQCSARRFAACKCSTLEGCKGLVNPPIRHPCCCHAIPNSTASCGAAVPPFSSPTVFPSSVCE